MSISPAELHAFLVDLDERGRRLLVHPGAAGAELVEELKGVCRRLLVSEEELRVVRAELARAQAQLEHLAAERYWLEASEDRPVVVTDSAGTVVRANRAAEKLVRRMHASAQRESIATWFAEPDRPAVRSLIRTVRAGREAPADTVLHVSHRGGSATPVSATVWIVSDPSGEDDLLLWRLDERSTGVSRGHLHAVADLGVDRSVDGFLVDALAELGKDLARAASVQAVATAAVYATVALLLRRPGAAHDAAYAACLSLTRDHGQHATVAGTRAPELDCERRQLDLQEGPTVAVLRGEPLVVSGEVAESRSWPRFAGVAGGAGVRSALAVRLELPRHAAGALTVYARTPGAFDAADERVATAVAAQCAVALGRAVEEDKLRVALANGQLIGEAVGILIERDRISPEAALEILAGVSGLTGVSVRDIAEHVVDTGADPGQVPVS